jgi:site-specific recombinase XerD
MGVAKFSAAGQHLIRHAYARRMARQGAPVADIQDVLGHESDKMAS